MISQINCLVFPHAELILTSDSICSSITEIVCYGIGQISEDSAAQYQLGVLLGLAEIMKVT